MSVPSQVFFLQSRARRRPQFLTSPMSLEDWLVPRLCPEAPFDRFGDLSHRRADLSDPRLAPNPSRIHRQGPSFFFALTSRASTPTLGFQGCPSFFSSPRLGDLLENYFFPPSQRPLPRALSFQRGDSPSLRRTQNPPPRTFEGSPFLEFLILLLERDLPRRFFCRASPAVVLRTSLFLEVLSDVLAPRRGLIYPGAFLRLSFFFFPFLP